jgi:hypothetical protein
MKLEKKENWNKQTNKQTNKLTEWEMQLDLDQCQCEIHIEKQFHKQQPLFNSY